MDSPTALVKKFLIAVYNLHFFMMSIKTWVDLHLLHRKDFYLYISIIDVIITANITHATNQIFVMGGRSFGG